jgi:arylsulfatase A-like enzyme
MPYTKPTVFGRSATPGYDGKLLERADDSLLYERIYKGTLYPDFPLFQIATHTGTKILAPEVRDELAAWAQRPDAGGIPLDESDVAFVKGLYATSAFYADSWLGVLFQEIRRLGLWDNLTVVVFSDHGEGLMAHEYVNHRSSLEDASTNCVLMIHRPGGHPARVDDVVELLDVAPTILDLAGADIPETFQGTSLFPCLERGRCPTDGIAYSEGIMRQVSMTDGIRRLTLNGYPAASADVDTELRTASWKDEHITYEDVRGPPGSETTTPPDGLFTELAQGGLKRRSR